MSLKLRKNVNISCGLCKSLFCTNNDVHLGIVYLPPDKSKYFNESDLSDLHDKISSICSNHPNVLIAGDWNARTAELRVYFEQDNFLLSE